MKKIYLAYLLLIILSACGSKNTNSVHLSGEIKGLGNDTLYIYGTDKFYNRDRKSTRLNSSHPPESRMPSSA